MKPFFIPKVSAEQEINGYLAANVIVEVIPDSGDPPLLSIRYTGDEVQALTDSVRMALAALDDLRNELALTRQERDRYVARVKLLEARAEKMREVLK
jgi:hypothetical protein